MKPEYYMDWTVGEFGYYCFVNPYYMHPDDPQIQLVYKDPNSRLRIKPFKDMEDVEDYLNEKLCTIQYNKKDIAVVVCNMEEKNKTAYRVIDENQNTAYTLIVKDLDYGPTYIDVSWTSEFSPIVGMYDDSTGTTSDSSQDPTE